MVTKDAVMIDKEERNIRTLKFKISFPKTNDPEIKLEVNAQTKLIGIFIEIRNQMPNRADYLMKIKFETKNQRCLELNETEIKEDHTLLSQMKQHISYSDDILKTHNILMIEVD